MPKSRFSQRLRNKLNREKEPEVPQISLQHLQPSFFPRNRRQQVPAQKTLKRRKTRRTVADSERERSAQRTKREEGAEEEDSEFYGTLNNDLDSATTEKTKKKKQKMARLHQLKKNFEN